MWDGTFSGAEFQSASKQFLKLWNNEEFSRYQWSWQECPDSSAQGYLILEGLEIDITNDEDEDNEEEQIEEEENSPDAATLTDFTRQPSRCTYHVIYNESYNVPTIYFRGYHSDGSPINWVDIQTSLPSQLAQHMEQNRWTFLTQEEHPYLHRPWFMLHPCGTSSIMSLIFSENMKASRAKGEGENNQTINSLSSHTDLNNKLEFVPPAISDAATWSVKNCADQYLLTWLSFVGPVVRLRVPLALFKSLH